MLLLLPVLLLHVSASQAASLPSVCRTNLKGGRRGKKREKEREGTQNKGAQVDKSECLFSPKKTWIYK